jgi:phosphinothricin acetyltransferase
MQIVIKPCDRSYAEPVLSIFNDVIATSTALYDYRPRTMEMMETWFQTKLQGGYPVLGALTPDGELMGFGTYGAFRIQPAYKYTVEHSVYVARAFRGHGIGRRLLEELIAVATQQGYHVLVGAIDAENATSIALHRQLGFQESGTLRQVGFKFGKWLDMVFYQLTLATPEHPRDG